MFTRVFVPTAAETVGEVCTVDVPPATPARRPMLPRLTVARASLTLFARNVTLPAEIEPLAPAIDETVAPMFAVALAPAPEMPMLPLKPVPTARDVSVAVDW